MTDEQKDDAMVVKAHHHFAELLACLHALKGNHRIRVYTNELDHPIELRIRRR